MSDTRGVLWVSGGQHVGFLCPGCGEVHRLRIRPAPSPSWEFNGDHERPTLSPSILVRSGQVEQSEKGEWTGEWILGSDG